MLTQLGHQQQKITLKGLKKGIPKTKKQAGRYKKIRRDRKVGQHKITELNIIKN